MEPLPRPAPPGRPLGAEHPPESLPDRLTVAVLGGGPAALAIAAEVAATGVDVGLLHAGPRLGDDMAGRDGGRVASGLAEHPHRLVAALGREAAGEIYAFTDQNRALLARRGWLRGLPGLSAAWDADEDPELDHARAALADLGRPCEALAAEDVDDALHARGFGRGRRAPETDAVDPHAVLAALRTQALDAGVHLATDARVRSLRDGPGGTRLALDGREVQADVVVIASGWRARDLDPWCADKVHPVREHYRRYAAAGGTVNVAAQHGWFQALTDPTGGLVVSGARWATPHMETGEEDDTVVSAKVDEALDRLVAQRFPAWHAAGPTHRWSAIAAHTCDQLPVVGPVPGRSGVIACFGWGGRPWSLALQAARSVADGLLERHAAPVPRWFSSRRFL